MYTLKFALETCSYCLPKRPGVSLPHSHNHPQRLGAGTIPRLHDTRQRYPLGASPAQAVPLPDQPSAGHSQRVSPSLGTGTGTVVRSGTKSPTR